MMKKNIGLLSLMVLLSAGYGYASSSAAMSDVSITKQAQQIITDAFSSMDKWMKRNPVIGSFSDNMVLDSKIATASDYMNKALDNLGRQLGNVPGMQNVKDTVGRAISALTTETTKGEAFNSAALSGIVNGVKILMLAPVKLSVNYVAHYSSAAVGAAGGAVAGFGAGISRTTKAIMSQNIQMSLEGVAKAIPSTMMHLLKGVVNTAALTAYGAAEGIIVGFMVGDNTIIGRVGTGNIFGLEKSNTDYSNTDYRAAEVEPQVEEDQYPSSYEPLSQSLGQNDLYRNAIRQGRQQTQEQAFLDQPNASQAANNSSTPQYGEEKDDQTEAQNRAARDAALQRQAARQKLAKQQAAEQQRQE